MGSTARAVATASTRVPATHAFTTDAAYGGKAAVVVGVDAVTDTNGDHTGASVRKVIEVTIARSATDRVHPIHVTMAKSAKRSSVVMATPVSLHFRSVH